MNEKLNKQPKNNQRKLFAIKYRSEMTDTSHYFVHTNLLLLSSNKCDDRNTLNTTCYQPQGKYITRR